MPGISRIRSAIRWRSICQSANGFNRRTKPPRIGFESRVTRRARARFWWGDAGRWLSAPVFWLHADQNRRCMLCGLRQHRVVLRSRRGAVPVVVCRVTCACGNPEGGCFDCVLRGSRLYGVCRYGTRRNASQSFATPVQAFLYNERPYWRLGTFQESSLDGMARAGLPGSASDRVL